MNKYSARHAIVVILYCLLSSSVTVVLAEDVPFTPSISVLGESNSPGLGKGNTASPEDIDEMYKQKERPNINKKLKKDRFGPATSNDFVGTREDIKVMHKLSDLPSLETTVHDWFVLSTRTQYNKKKCYIVNYPTEMIGNHKAKRMPYLMVVFDEYKRHMLFIASGYEFAKGSKVFISVDGKQFSIASKEYIAAADDIAKDVNMIQAMLNGSRVLVHARSIIGSYSVDIYSMLHFAEAYKKMFNICSQ